MGDSKIKEKKKELIFWASQLYNKGFVVSRSGNISYKLDSSRILITSHDSYLGYLTEEDILLLDLDGNVLEGEKEPTSEKQLHLEIHRSFPQISVVLHAHPPFTVGFFEVFEKLNIFSFEAKFYLGDVKAIPQSTPIVSDTEPIIKHLENSNIVVLKNHGVVSVGKNFRESFSLIELLEQQCKVNLFLKDKGEAKNTDERTGFSQKVIRRYKLLSEEHINKLVKLVNNDPQLQELGKKYNFTCSLAVKDKTTGKVVCFYYKEGRIVKVDSDAGAEFVIVGDSSILKKIFNREIDPFVASTQGKIKTEGDFTKMSKWYPVLVRTFQLWEEAPVE